MRIIIALIAAVQLVFAITHVASAQSRPEDIAKAMDKMRQMRSEQLAIEENRRILFSAYKMMLVDKENAMESLELSQSQKDSLENMVGEYSTKVVNLFGDIPGSKELDFQEMTSSKEFIGSSPEKQQELIKIQNEFTADLCDLFLPAQVQAMRFFNFGSGLPKMLLESPAGSMIELSDKQRANIKKRSVKLSDEIAEIVGRIRKESREIIVDELTDEQLEKLKLMISKKQFERYPQQFPLDIIGFLHHFPDN